MKTKLLFMILLFITNFAKANPFAFSEKDFNLKMSEYIYQASYLSDKIKASGNKDSIKIYAKQLMSLSEEMESTISKYYNYKGIQTSYVLLFTDPPSFGTVVSFPESVPKELSSAYLIWDGASNIKYFFSNNPNKILKNLAKIEKAIQELNSN